MPLLAVIMLSVGLLLDIVNLALGVRKCARGAGASGLPLFPWLFYLVACLLSGIPWISRLVLLVILTCFHAFCMGIGPALYSSFLNGRSPLHRAVICGNAARVRRLIESGMDPNGMDNSGWTPLHLAAALGTEDSVALLLLEAGADPSAPDRNDVTPMIVAAGRGKSAVLQRMVASANVDLKGEMGARALKSAIMGGHKELVDFLLTNGAAIDVNARNVNGQTLLHRAVNIGQMDRDRCLRTAEMLISLGADINATNQAGLTPLDSARRYDTSVADYLQRVAELRVES